MCETPQVIQRCYHGNRDNFVTLLFEDSWSSCLESIFFVPVEFCSTTYCYGNNVAMATDKCLFDSATVDELQAIFGKNCAEIIASGASCSLINLCSPRKL